MRFLIMPAPWRRWASNCPSPIACSCANPSAVSISCAATTCLRAYRVALGLNPGGAKERAGDFRTPEGSYRLTRRNTRSDFFLSIQVSYPNDQDMRRARRNGWQPGGSIMIHGLPNDPRHSPDYYASQDWTDGCIAVTNADMVEIWMMTSDNVRIDIQP